MDSFLFSHFTDFSQLNYCAQLYFQFQNGFQSRTVNPVVPTDGYIKNKFKPVGPKAGPQTLTGASFGPPAKVTK